jgi:spermidine synthase
MKTFLKSLLTPQTVEVLDSPYSGKLTVRQAGRDFYITTGTLTQSGNLIKELWTSVFKKITPRKKSSWLILGLGGGSVAHLISQKYSPSSITGIEIDKHMLALGKKYLHLSTIPNLTIINSDASYFLSHLKVQFDYVLVDMYLADQLPKFVYSQSFIDKLGQIGRVIIFNHLFYDPTNKSAANQLVNATSRSFSSVILHRALTNLLIICSGFAKPV